MLPSIEYVKTMINGIVKKIESIQQKITKNRNDFDFFEQKSKTHIRSLEQETEIVFGHVNKIYDNINNLNSLIHDISHQTPLFMPSSFVGECAYIDVTNYQHFRQSGFMFKVIFSDDVNFSKKITRIRLFNSTGYFETDICLLPTANGNYGTIERVVGRVCYLMVCNNVGDVTVFIPTLETPTNKLRTYSEHAKRYLKGGSQGSYIEGVSSSELFTDIMPTVSELDNGKVLKVVNGSWQMAENGFLTIQSSTPDSIKKFKITVDDSGALSATEVTD